MFEVRIAALDVADRDAVRAELDCAVSGKLSIAPPYEPQGEKFKGLMALLTGCELALVDLGRGLSMHSGAGKDHNMEKAKASLETALRDFKRGNAL